MIVAGILEIARGVIVATLGPVVFVRGEDVLLAVDFAVRKVGGVRAQVWVRLRVRDRVRVLAPRVGFAAKAEIVFPLRAAKMDFVAKAEEGGVRRAKPCRA